MPPSCPREEAGLNLTTCQLVLVLTNIGLTNIGLTNIGLTNSGLTNDTYAIPL